MDLYGGKFAGLAAGPGTPIHLRRIRRLGKSRSRGSLASATPWLPYHENLTEMAARLVGAKPIEVVIMNTLTVNLHLMMVSFYRPTKERYKIIIEADAFPSDRYAVDSQATFHGFDPKTAIVALRPREGEFTLRPEDILQAIQKKDRSLH